MSLYMYYRLKKLSISILKFVWIFLKKDKDIKEIEVREKIARSKPKTKQSWPPSLTANDERQIAVQQGLQNISTPDFSTPSFNHELFQHFQPWTLQPWPFNHELFNLELFNHEHFNHELFNYKLFNHEL